MKKQNIRNIAVTAIMGAIGFILMMLEFPISFLIPSFIKFDFSELPALVTAFALGPWWAVMVCFVKNALHLFVGTTAGVGELSNFVLGAIFVGVGVGLVVRVGGAAGGDDALALLIQHFTHLPIDRCYLFTDTIVLTLSLSYIPFNQIIYSFITVTLSSFIIGKINRLNIKKVIE